MDVRKLNSGLFAERAFKSSILHLPKTYSSLLQTIKQMSEEAEGYQGPFLNLDGDTQEISSEDRTILSSCNFQIYYHCEETENGDWRRSLVGLLVYTQKLKA